MRLQIGAFSVGLFALCAHAEPVYQIKSEGAIACESAEALHTAITSQNGQLPQSCTRLEAGYAFEAINRSDTYVPKSETEPILGLIYGRPIATANERSSASYFKVLRSAAEPVLDDKGKVVMAKCDYPQTFVTNKLLAAPDGKLYLKQGKVTIKCVNGEMRQIYQPRT